jgi:DNA-directed RNA polymerase specialized sigma24 family protein
MFMVNLCFVFLEVPHTMTRILDLFLKTNGVKACNAYPDPKSLFEGLAEEAPAAVRCLSSKIAGSIYKLGKQFQLLDEDIEELMCDCITLLIEKIRAGKYAFKGNDPASYAIEIAKFKVRNYRRNVVKDATKSLTAEQELIVEEEAHFSSFEQTELLQSLLQKVGDNCEKLIRLRYIDECKDMDVIAQKTTQYTTVDALKNKRAQCLKKLIALAKQQAVR